MYAYTLHLANGTIHIVEAPPLVRSRRLLAYHQELRTRINPHLSWFIQNQITDPVALDLALMPYMEQIATAIAQLLTPKFDLSTLTPSSRYEFFIATAPYKHPDYEAPIPGLSGLEQLLGLSHHSQVTLHEQQVVITSGDSEIDLMADLLLVFPENAIALSRKYSSAYLSKLVVQASKRQQGDKTIDEEQQERDRTAFEKHEEALASSFRKMGVPLF